MIVEDNTELYDLIKSSIREYIDDYFNNNPNIHNEQHAETLFHKAIELQKELNKILEELYKCGFAIVQSHPNENQRGLRYISLDGLKLHKLDMTYNGILSEFRCDVNIGNLVRQILEEREKGNKING